MTEPDPFVPKGKLRPLSGQTCGYFPRTASARCGMPGAWHIRWDTLDNSVTCKEHMTVIQQQWVYDDRHPISGDCTMPGAVWLYRDRKCEVPGIEAALAESAAGKVRL